MRTVTVSASDARSFDLSEVFPAVIGAKDDAAMAYAVDMVAEYRFYGPDALPLASVVACLEGC